MLPTAIARRHRSLQTAAVAAATLAAASSLQTKRKGDGVGIRCREVNEKWCRDSKDIRQTYQAHDASSTLLNGLIHGNGVPSKSIPKICSCESTALVPNTSHRQKIMARFNRTSSRSSLESEYKIDWHNPLGEGGYGSVYMCTNRKTGTKHALKKIPKVYTDDSSFQREMDALLRVRESGSHPNICRLKENFDERGSYFLVLDLISGGEMFDQLCQDGAYSEADAARLLMETSSALAFLHGVGLVHADLKPENLMLSTRNKTDSVIKVVDFGLSESYKGSDNIDFEQIRKNTSTTPAYSPPEAFEKCKGPLQPSFDMWSLGCIIYIMLTGRHPFDIDGVSTDAEMEEKIKKGDIPLRNSPFTAHLSDSAINLIEKLLDRDPRRRMTAMQMLDHPWVKGRTARTNKMKDSDKKLQGFRKFKSRLEVKVFAEWISGATTDAAKKTSLIERAFKSLDISGKGYVTKSDLNRTLTKKGEKPVEDEDYEVDPLSLSGFSDLLSDNMTNEHYPEGHCIYKEGSKGDAIYFINSGSVEVSTWAGFKTTLSQGQLFGEGALLDEKGQRNATIRCLTPVHAVRISKDYFQKYMAAGGLDINLTLREQDRARDRDQALKILRLHKNLVERDFVEGERIFSAGEGGKSVYIVDEGVLKITGATGKHILDIHAGDIVGEHAFITGMPRTTTAICASNDCKLYEMNEKDFSSVFNSSPSIKQSLREVCFRRVFQKAISKKTGRDFGTNNEELREAFNTADLDGDGVISLEEVKTLLGTIYPSLPADDPLFTQALEALNVAGNHSIGWEEFKKVFSSENE